jgi:HAE1 family hydrophobic/amphiphilic exporter-1
LRVLVERPIAVAMVYLALLALGVFSFVNTPIELAPGGNYPRIDIEAPWPGVSPEVVQSRVTARLEEAAASVRGVRRVSSESRAGAASITLEIDPRARMEFVDLALREAVARARDSLPYGVRPVVQPFVPEDFRVRPFLSATVSGPYSLQELRGLLKESLELGLGSVPGVSSVEVAGGSDPEVRVVLDESRMEALGLRPFEVDAALAMTLAARPAGRVRRTGREYIFKVARAIESLPDLGRVLVGRAGGVPVRLSDVADVLPCAGEVRSVIRIDGRPAVILTVTKESGANTLRVAREVRRRLALLRKGLSPDLVFRTVDDESAEIERNLRRLGLLASVIIALIFLMIFLALRRLLPSLLILSSVAFSVVITFTLLYVLRIPLNMLTLGALAVGFGMFVDNSVVVFENILRLRERGLPPERAALQGAREVFLPVLASTLTTIGVFLCFPFFQGRLRVYYLPLALVMSSALAASLAVSFSLVPALSPRLLEPVKRRGPKDGRRDLFPAALRFVIKHPAGTMLVAAALLFGGYKWFRSEVAMGEFFSWYSKERLMVSLSLPDGTDMEATDAVIREFEDKVMEAGYEKEMTVRVSRGNAFLSVGFPSEVERSFRPYVLKEELIRLATRFAGVTVGVFGFDPRGYASSMEPGTFYDSQIEFLGYDLEKLRTIAGEMEQTLGRNPRVREVRTVSSRGGWPSMDSFEIVLSPDTGAPARFDVDPAQLRVQIRSLVAGSFDFPLKAVLGGRETDVVLNVPGAEKMDLERLRGSLFRTAGGRSLRLGDVLTAEEKPIAGPIDRENRQFQRTVMWKFRGPFRAAEDYRKAIFAGLSLPPGFSASPGEDWRMTGQEEGQITLAAVVAVVVIFMILAAFFESLVQPFIVLTSVPLALVGVFASFVVAGARFDSSAYIGVLLMSGIVVNNAILIVDHVNLKRREGRGLAEAVIEGTRERVRPILMTTGTTVLGTMPMLLLRADAGKSDIWSSLALCLAGGLTASTPLMLAVIPVLYHAAERLRPRSARKAREIQRLWSKK